MKLKKLRMNLKDLFFWIAGDFNLPDIDWNSFSITGHNYSWSINQLLLDLIWNLGLSQAVGAPTRGSNTLDLFFTSHLDLHQNSQVIPGVTDHEAVLTVNKLFIKTKKPIKRVIKLWNQADITNLKNYTKNFATLFKSTMVNT